MSDEIAALQAGILAAVPTLTGLSGVTVKTSRRPDAIFSLQPPKPLITLSYTGRVRRTTGPISRRDKYKMAYQWAFALLDADYGTAAGSLAKAGTMSEALLAIRNVQIGTVGGDPVYLYWVSDQVMDDPGSGPEAGNCALVMLFETTDVLR